MSEKCFRHINGYAVKDAFARGAIHYLTPEMFGAKGDGLTDDYAAFSEMINKANEQSKNIVLAKRSYRLSATLDITEPVTIYGNDATLIVDGAATVGINIHGNRARHFKIKDITLLMNPEVDNYGVRLSGLEHPILENIRVVSANCGFHILKCINAFLHRCEYNSARTVIHDINRGFYLECYEAQSQSTYLSECIATFNHIEGAKYGFDVRGNDVRDVFFCHCEASEVTHGFVVEATSALMQPDIKFTDCVVDRAEQMAIWIIGCENVGGISIVGGWFRGYGHGIRIQNFSNVTVTGAQIFGQYENCCGISISNAPGLSVSNCIFTDCVYALELPENSNAIGNMFCSTGEVQLGFCIKCYNNAYVTGNITGKNVGTYEKGVECSGMNNVVTYNRLPCETAFVGNESQNIFVSFPTN